MTNKRMAITALIALVFASTSYAQSRVTLTVVVNEGPAQVILSGRLLGIANPRFSGSVQTGTYELIVRKSGLPESKQTVTIGSGGLTVNVRLGSASVMPPPTVISPPTVTPPPVANYAVNIASNVTNADVYINNTKIGTTPLNTQLPRGSYSLIVRAQGYADYTQTVNISGTMTINATLQALTVPLNLGRLLPGAEIFLNGASYGKAGQSPFILQIVPGSYTLTIRLAGYLDLTTQITVGGGGTTIAPSLQPITANYSFEIPAAILNPEMRGNPWSQLRLYIDGVAQSEFRGQVNAGNRRIKLVTGAFQIEMDFVFEAGKSYTFQPFAGFNVLK